MTVSYVSSLASRELLRSAMARSQRQLDIATLESSSGRYADVGLVLGAQTGRTLEMRQVASEAKVISQTNQLTATRLDLTQSVLSSLGDLANEMFNSATAARQINGNRDQFIADAKSKLSTLMDLISTTSNGAYIFSGVETAKAPLDNYLQNPPGTARSAIVAGFTTEFGFAPDDPQAATISKAQLDAYLDGTFASNFQDPQWQSTFSSASDSPLRTRISWNETVETPVSANSPAIRTLVSALVSALDSGTANLNSEAFTSLASRVADAASRAVSELAQSQAAVGSVQERLTKASERMNAQQTLFEKQVANLEEVDPFEAVSRLNSLKTKLEASYSMTASLQRLSILDYL